MAKRERNEGGSIGSRIKAWQTPTSTHGANSARSAQNDALAPRSVRARADETRCDSPTRVHGYGCARSLDAISSASAWCRQSRWASSPDADPPS